MSDGSPEPILEVLGTGETVGEAKWAALRQLELRMPGLDRDQVEYVVLQEGERGLLGVGYEEAQVAAQLLAAPAVGSPTTAPDDDDEMRTVRELIERICGVVHPAATVGVSRFDDRIVATLGGRELGPVIGRRGQTIDAIGYVVGAAVSRSAGHRVDVTVDAANYRARRRRALEALADQAASEVLASGTEATLEPMTPSERKIVHVRLQDHPDVETESDGAEPNRCVVVKPLSG